MKHPTSKLTIAVASAALLLLAGPALADRDDRFGYKGPQHKLSHASDRGERGHSDRGRGRDREGHRGRGREHRDRDHGHDRGHRGRDHGYRGKGHGHRDKRHYHGSRHYYGDHYYGDRGHYKRRYYKRRHHWRPHHYGYGYRWRHLPRNYVRISFGGLGFYYSDGIFYRPFEHGYVVAPPPVGALVYSLPASAMTLVFGGRHYYVAYDTYYLWDAPHRGYRVVANPGFY